MRRFLTFPCAGATLAATIDAPTGAPRAGLLIVSGGTEIRSGAHGGMARLAQAASDAGYLALRFDRRGVGDSAGDDPGFENSAPDLAAAATLLRTLLPDGVRLLGFGICDGAAALALHHRAIGIDGLLLANPFVVEPTSGLPPPAAIRRHYARRLLDPTAWKRAITGRLGYRAALRGVASLTRRGDHGLTDRIATALAGGDMRIAILLAMGDGTAIAFDAAWNHARFAPVRAGGRAEVIRIDSASHSFAGADAAVLAGFVRDGLARAEA